MSVVWPTPRTPGTPSFAAKAAATPRRRSCSTQTPVESCDRGRPAPQFARSADDPGSLFNLTFFDEACDRRFGAPGRLCPGLRRGARGGSPRPKSPRHLRASSARRWAHDGATRCERSCKPTVMPASGRATRSLAHVLEAGDIEEGLRAASAVGDDTLQRRSGGSVIRTQFTHGSSARRMQWFRRGMKDGWLRELQHLRQRRALKPSSATALRPRRRPASTWLGNVLAVARLARR